MYKISVTLIITWFAGDKETCGLQHLDCLASINIQLRNPIAAEEEYAGISYPDWSVPLTMWCECISPCSYTTYETDITEVPAEEMNGHIGSSR
ncbi:hypothetical protein J6590_063133 [Homalodisca vitripennis]|nr:hypothetical protein J6590_063133 [Homalodisca vitripennis]